MARRLEITVSEETWGRLELARGHEPRASFVKRALESALGDSRGPDRQAPNEGGPGLPSVPASSRASKSTAAELKGLQNFADQMVVDQREAAMDRQRRLNERKAK